MAKFEASSEPDKSLAYDLRGIYAMHIAGPHLIDIMEARKSENYSTYLKNMEDLYTVIHHKIRNVKENEKKYKDLIIRVSLVATRNPSTWLNKGGSPQVKAELESALRDVEMFLYQMMEDANMFGSSYDDGGL